MRLKKAIANYNIKYKTKLTRTNLAYALCLELGRPVSDVSKFRHLFWRLEKKKTFSLDLRLIRPICKILECTPNDLLL